MLLLEANDQELDFHTVRSGYGICMIFHRLLHCVQVGYMLKV